MARDNIFILRELDKFASITDSINAKNLELENKVLEQKVIEANYYISKQLEVPLATKLFYLSKLRIVEGIPRSIEKTYIDYEFVKGMENEDLNNVSFYSVLEKKTGIKTIKSQEEMLIVEANESECELLNLNTGEEVLLLKGVTYKDEIRPFEYFEITSLTSFYRFRSVSNI